MGLPKCVIKDIGTDLTYVQYGRTPSSAKPLSNGVMEIVFNLSKKSKQGKKIPPKDKEIIDQQVLLRLFVRALLLDTC